MDRPGSCDEEKALMQRWINCRRQCKLKNSRDHRVAEWIYI